MSLDPITQQAQRLWPRWFIAGSKPVKVDLGPAGSGPLVDISGGGLRVQSLAPLRRGAEVPVHIDIPDQAEPFHCSGIVVWSKPNGAAGIRFTTIPDLQKPTLNRWLAELEQTSTSPAHSQAQDEFTSVVSQVRGAQLSNADALNLIVRRAKELSSVSGAVIALGKPENMTCMASVGEAPQVGSTIPAVIGIAGDCIFKRKTVSCEDSKNDPRVSRDSGFGSAVMLPLVVNNEVRGLMQAFSKRSYAFTNSAIDTLEKLADAVVFVTHGIVTPRRLAAAKATVAHPGNNLGPKAHPTLSPLTASFTAPSPTVQSSPTTSVKPYEDSPVKHGSLLGVPAERFTPKPTIWTPVPAETMPQAGPAAGPSSSFAVAPVAEDIVYEQPVAVSERIQPQAVPVPASNWQSKSSPNPSIAKWVIGIAVVAVAATTGVRLYKTPKPSTPASAEQVAEPTIAAPLASSPSTTTQMASAATVPVVANRLTDHKGSLRDDIVLPPSVVKHEQHEQRTNAAVAAVTTPTSRPEAAPIVLAASKPKAPKPLDLDTVVPIATPPSLSAPTSVSRIALPAANKLAPKFVPPPPEVKTGGSLIKRVEPVYPTMARTANMQGLVELQIHVNKDGVVDRVTRLSGQPVLAGAAIDAVKQWRYDPARVNGNAVDMETVVRLNFQLSR